MVLGLLMNFTVLTVIIDLHLSLMWLTDALNINALKQNLVTLVIQSLPLKSNLAIMA